MLIVSRTEGRSILIGDSIEVIVLEVRGGQVRLGIKAPSDLKVLRSGDHVETTELTDQWQEHQRAESQRKIQEIGEEFLAGMGEVVD